LTLSDSQTTTHAPSLQLAYHVCAAGVAKVAVAQVLRQAAEHPSTPRLHRPAEQLPLPLAGLEQVGAQLNVLRHLLLKDHAFPLAPGGQLVKHLVQALVEPALACQQMQAGQVSAGPHG
jgi:hypothetical protein